MKQRIRALLRRAAARLGVALAVLLTLVELALVVYYLA